ncbi:MAG: helix-turn-helix domain-containing protein, partial [Roseibium sp.]|nr:helix-turn-helix domain-containing protein [Roseibium sp.]
QPPGDWLTQVRIEATKKLLVEGTDDMETIAMLVGFGSAHALRHHFRKRLGIRPTDFRRQFGKKAA